MKLLSDFNLKKDKLTRRIFLSLSLACLLCILLILKTNQDICEFVTRYISSFYIELVGTVTSVIPLSLYELIIIALIFLILLFIVRLADKLRLRQFRAALSFVALATALILAVADLYILTASFAYNRDKVDIPLYDKSVDGQLTLEDMTEVANDLLSDLQTTSASLKRDESGAVVCPYTFNELCDKISDLYAELDSDYLSDFSPSPKKIINTLIMKEMRLTGVFFAPLGEITINTGELDCNLPVVIAHEMAHSKGVMREDDANLYAYYVTLKSDDPYIRYCALYNVYYKILSAVSYYPNSYKTYLHLSSSVPDEVLKEERLEISYWSEYTALADISSFFNDIYLKLSGEEEGEDSYGDHGIIEDTGTTDDFERPVYTVISFSPIQNLLIKMYS